MLGEQKGTLLNYWNNLERRILNSGNSTTSHTAYLLATIDRKVDLHRRKKMVLDDLFKALLHKLMTGEIRITDVELSALID